MKEFTNAEAISLIKEAKALFVNEETILYGDVTHTPDKDTFLTFLLPQRDDNGVWEQKRIEFTRTDNGVVLVKKDKMFLHAADGNTHTIQLLHVRDIVKCEHTCSCGGCEQEHLAGDEGCNRFIAPFSPIPVFDQKDMWSVDGHIIADFTLRQQRGYHQHPCGCWSRWHGSTNSIDA